MNKAEELFFSLLNDGIFKDAQLDPNTVAALEIKNPDLLEQLEEQASAKTQQEQPPEETQDQVQEEPVSNEPVQVESEAKNVTIHVPKSIFKNNSTHPLKLLVVLKIKYNDKWVHWLPETLWEAIRRDIGPVGEINQNKIQALALSLATDIPWQDWHVFENCGKAFNDNIPLFGHMQPLSPAEIAFTVKLLKDLQDFKFSDEVLGYIASCCLYSGLIYLPKQWFDKAQTFVDKQNQNLELKDEVEQAWKAVAKKDLSVVEFDESKPVDVQIAKLWAIREHLKNKDVQLKEN